MSVLLVGVYFLVLVGDAALLQRDPDTLNERTELEIEVSEMVGELFMRGESSYPSCVED